MHIPLLAMPLIMLGWPEWLLIGAVVALLFGAKKLPQLGKGLGEGIRNFTKGIKGDSEDKDQLAQKEEDDASDDKDKS